MADDDADFWARHLEQKEQIAALLDQCNARALQIQAVCRLLDEARTRLDASRRRLDR